MSESNPAPYRRGHSRWVWLLILVLVLGGGYWYWQKRDASAQNNEATLSGRRMAGMAIPVKTVTAEVGHIDTTLKAIGTVTAFNTVTVRSRVDGELQKLVFADGQRVKEGDLLAQIDPRTYQVQLDQALGMQKQNLALLANAQRDLKRYQLLFKQNSIARQQVDAQLALVQQLEGSKKSDQAAVDSAALQLSFTRITAPISGRLGLRKVDQGNLVNASSTEGLVVITQTQPISVVFTLPQSQLPQVLAKVRAGKTLKVELFDRADQNKIATGDLMSIDNQIDLATGTLMLKARFANEDESLFPNQFVNIRLQVDTEEAVLVPTRAVQQGSVGAFVYVVNDENKVNVQPIVTGVREGKQVAIASGLQSGQRVVIEGVDRLREGATVEIVTPVSGAVASGAAASPAIPATGGPAGAGGTPRGGSPH